MAQQVRTKRLSVWYEEKNDAWTRWSKRFGFYRVENSLVNGKPSYTSEHQEGAYAIWYGENRNWCLGRSSSRGKKEFCFYARGKVKSGGDDICPTDTGGSMEETFNLQQNLNCNFLSLCFYLFKNCPQFLSHWESAYA